MFAHAGAERERRRPAARDLRDSGSRVTSTSASGCSMFSRIRSTRLVPPPRNLACGRFATASHGLRRCRRRGDRRTASSSAAFVQCARPAGSPRRSRIGAAAAQVAAHALLSSSSLELRPVRRASGVTALGTPRSTRAACRRRSRSGPACNSRTGIRRASMKAACSGCSSAPSADALDRGDLAPVVLHRQREAGQDALAVDQHRAGAARALVAALLRADEAEVLAQGVEQAYPRVDRQVVRDAVDAQGQRHSGRRRGPFDGLARFGGVDRTWLQLQPHPRERYRRVSRDDG